MHLMSVVQAENLPPTISGLPHRVHVHHPAATALLQCAIRVQLKTLVLTSYANRLFPKVC